MEREYLVEWPPLERDEPDKKKAKKDTNTILASEEVKLVQKEETSHARTLLAQWWKWKQRQNSNEDEQCLPNSTSPNTLLHHVAKLPSAQRFLNHRITYLLTKHQFDSTVLASISSCHHIMGNIEEAMTSIKQALDSSHQQQCTNEYNDIRWKKCLITKQYEVFREQNELLKVLRDKEKAGLVKIGLPQPIQVERRHVSTLSYKDFFLNYAMTCTPLIITGLAGEITTTPWTLDHIKKTIGDKIAPLRQLVTGSVEWAQLEPAGQCMVGEFIDGLEDQNSKSLKYLFDWSLPLYCPNLVHELTIPKYFAGDLLQRTPVGSLYRDSWPSLFIAPAGIMSALHVDAFGSNFWMALFHGRKKWLFFPPEDLPCLYPIYTHSTDAVFELNLSADSWEEHPLICLTHPRECILEPGEILFVPAGSPHQVENLELSLAISSNFVDMSNLKLVQEELKINSLQDPRAAELLQAFNEEGFPLYMDELQESLPWDAFKAWPRDVEKKLLI